MKIRQEKPSDYNEVYELVKISFATNLDDDGTTSDYLVSVYKVKKNKNNCESVIK